MRGDEKASTAGDELSIAETMRRIGLALTSELDLDKLVQLITDEATALVKAQFGAFFYNVVRADGEAFMLFTLSGAPREAFSKFGMPRNTAVFAPTFAGEGVVRVADITADPRYGKNTPNRGMPVGHLPVRSYLAVPVKSPTGEVHGGLFFGHADVGVFDERSERCVVGLAAQAAIAIDNARYVRSVRDAHSAEERRSRNLALVADVAVAFAKGPELGLALRQSTDAIVEHLDAAFARIWTLDAAGTTLELQVSSGQYTHIDGPHARVPVGAFKIGKIAEERAPHLSNKVVEDPRVGDREWARREGMVSFAGYPLLIEGRCIGVIALFSKSELNDDTLRTLASVADVVSVGIDRKRAELARRTAEARQAALVDLGRALATSLDYEATLDRLTSAIVPRLADWCSIHILPRTGAARRSVVVHRDPARSDACAALMRYVPAPDATDPPSVAMRTSAPVLVSQLSEAVAAAEHLPLLRALGAGGAVAVPLFARERLVGAITFVAEAPNRYSNDDIVLFEEIARRAGLALDNARLYGDAENARRRLSSIFEQTPAAIAVTRGQNHVIESANPKYLELVGERALIGKTVREAFPDAGMQAFVELLDGVYSSGQSYVGNEVLAPVYRGGAEQKGYFNFVYQPLVEDDGEIRGIMTFAVEVTELVRARHRVEHLVNALERSNQELDQFAYVASHDLKAPLRGIANLSEWIEEGLAGNLDPEVKKHLDLLRGRVHRLEALIEGILGYSRAGRIRDEIERIDSGALVREVVELIAPSSSARIEIAAEMPTLPAERIPLQQVFMNLIGNALKHARRDDPHVTVGFSDAGDAWQFHVRDNGPGIAPHFHERIWGIFQTLEARDRVEGTGIGLSIVKKVVETRGGRVWLESTDGNGATFYVAWPKEPVQATR